MRHAEPPAAANGIDPSLHRYLTLAQTCHELFELAFGEDKPPEHAAMDELLRALDRAPGLPYAPAGDRTPCLDRPARFSSPTMTR